jgi:hypothetical protein
MENRENLSLISLLVVIVAANAWFLSQVLTYWS